MTCREKLKLEHPDKVNDGHTGGCEGCPSRYGYLEDPDYCGTIKPGNCTECWDREIPEEEASEATFEKREIISQHIKDAMAKFSEKGAELSKELDKAYESWSRELPEKFKPATEMESDENVEPKKPDEAEEVIEKFNESGSACAQSPEDIRKALERSSMIISAQMAADELIKEVVIKDSGNRTEFPSGAVRDMREGKGRCDLMPLDVVADVLRDPIIEEIAKFQEDKDVTHLYKTLLNVPQSEVFSDVYTMILEVAKHFEAGCKKYGEDNWRKGIPAKCYIDSAVRHYLKFLRGDKDEPHDRAFVWNILCCIWTVKHLGFDATGAEEQ